MIFRFNEVYTFTSRRHTHYQIWSSHLSRITETTQWKISPYAKSLRRGLPWPSPPLPHPSLSSRNLVTRAPRKTVRTELGAEARPTRNAHGQLPVHTIVATVRTDACRQRVASARVTSWSDLSTSDAMESWSTRRSRDGMFLRHIHAQAAW